MAQRLLIEPQSGDEDSDCEEDDLLLKDPTQSYYNVNFAPVLKVSYLEVQCGCLGQGQFLLIFISLAMKIKTMFLSESHFRELVKTVWRIRGRGDIPKIRQIFSNNKNSATFSPEKGVFNKNKKLFYPFNKK